MNYDKVQALCHQLTPENANLVCKMLLEQRVTDEFVHTLSPVEIRQKRRIFQLKNWLIQQLPHAPGLTPETRAEWKRKIETIEDVIVQHFRDIYGNVNRKVLLFFPRTTAFAGTGGPDDLPDGYICVSTFQPGSILAAKTASVFSSWISSLTPRLIAQYNTV